MRTVDPSTPVTITAGELGELSDAMSRYNELKLLLKLSELVSETACEFAGCIEVCRTTADGRTECIDSDNLDAFLDDRLGAIQRAL